jgi:hypothetical protein
LSRICMVSTGIAICNFILMLGEMTTAVGSPLFSSGKWQKQGG